MPEFSPEDRARVWTWLREQAFPEDGSRGLSSYRIREILKPHIEGGISQKTVQRAMAVIRASIDGENEGEAQPLGNKITRAILAFIAFQEAKRVADAKPAVVTHVQSAVRDTPTEAPAEPQQEPHDPELEQRRQVVSEQLQEVAQRQWRRKLISQPDVSLLSGDIQYHLETLEPFEYKNGAAEMIGFMHPDAEIGGWLVHHLTKEVSAKQRMLESALPPDASHDCRFGKRQANLVTVRPYPDKQWFWGWPLEREINLWREQLEKFEPWIRDGVPEHPPDYMVDIYKSLLYLTTRMHERGIVYEGPAPDVNATTVEAAIDDLHRKIRRARRKRLKKRVFTVLGVIGLVVPSLYWIIQNASRGVSWLDSAIGHGLSTTSDWIEGIWTSTTSLTGLAILSLIAFLVFAAVAAYTGGRPSYENNKVALCWTVALAVVLLLLTAALARSWFRMG